jgi:hypothetical protein
VVEVAHHLEILAAGQVLVDGGVLSGQADQAADQPLLLVHVVPEDTSLSAVRLQDGGQNAHGGRLARPVGAEQAEHCSLVDAEADAVEGAHRVLAGECLDQCFGFDGMRHGAAFLSVCWSVEYRLPMVEGSRGGRLVVVGRILRGRSMGVTRGAGERLLPLASGPCKKAIW